MIGRHLPCLLALATEIVAVLLLSAPRARAQEQHASAHGRLPVHAGSFSLKLDSGLAFPLTRPQSQLFSFGGGQTIKALWALTPYLDLGPSATFIGLPADDPENSAGTAWAFGGSVQLKRPHHASSSGLAAVSPWLDVDVTYVRTDTLDRAGLAAAAGLAFPIGDARIYWLGPFVRYFQIFSGQRVDINDNDARILSLGLSLEVSVGIRREHQALIDTRATGIRVIEKHTIYCPDRDADGIPDDVDRCPDEVGPMNNWGCHQEPEKVAPEKVAVVQPAKLELTGKLYFALDKPTIQEVSYPVLDEVVRKLNENRAMRVRVEGHTSSEGSDDHNQKLSEQRAQAVVDYLVAHGIAKERLSAKGFASSVPIDTNNSPSGRVNNRRVEFVVVD